MSILSARSIYTHLDRESFQAYPVGMTDKWEWVQGEDADRMLMGGDFTPCSKTMDVILKEYNTDIVFPMIHGTFGEDGTLQGYLETLGYPYVGCGVAASALGMDKSVQKAVWSSMGLPVVPWRTLTRESWKEEYVQLNGFTDLPVFVKPADSGSSVGISRVTDWQDLEPALEAAFSVSRKAVVEKGILGRELEVAVLGGYEPDIVSAPGEIIPGAEFYDYRDKYIDNRAQVLVPADLPEETVKTVRNLARQAYRGIGGYGMARVDFFLDSENRCFINEINTIPGFTSISMYPKLIMHENLSYTNLLTRLLDLTGV